MLSEANAQRLLKLSMDINGSTKHISYITRNGLVFASAKEIATALSGNYYYAEETSKLELKFANYNMKVTGRNQFVVLTNRNDNSQEVFQMPISTLLVKGDVFVPMKYALKYIQTAYGNEIKFDDGAKHISAEKPIERVIPRPIVAAPKPGLDNYSSPTSVNENYDIFGMDIEEKLDGTLIRLKCSGEIHKFSTSILNNKLFLFISGVTIEPDLLKNFKSIGFVRKAEMKSVGDNKQLEFLLKQGYSAHESMKEVGSNDILVTIQSKKYHKTEAQLSKEKERWTFDTIVLDAGHGGKDPGAIGITGVKEKDVNLGVTLELGKLIAQEMPDVKVIYTRETDKFVELHKRGTIANENKGKLFISLHANSLGRKRASVRGFEVYLLRPGRTEEAIEIAERENSVINLESNPQSYQKLDDENFILVSMAHSAYMKYSERFSDILCKKWANDLSRIPVRGIKQAGLYVLVGASMPSVLVELGYLSNRKDEAYLKSKSGRKEMAKSLFNSIKEYRTYYEENLRAET